MATWTGDGPNSRTFVSNIKTGERSWQVDLDTRNHSEIMEMQQKLTNLGYSTQGVDGTYGNNTKSAVINFQRAFPACGTPDGYFGKNTLNTFVSIVGSLAGYTGSGNGEDSGGDNGDGDGENPPVSSGEITHGKINHSSWVNIRATASSSGEIIGRLFDGDPLDFYTGEVHTVGGVDWYRIKLDGDAYIQKRYVENETYNRNVVETYSFNKDAAVAYAANHTANGECNNYNTTFDMHGSDCANFVNQCLCAGGLPMFDGWGKPVVSSVPSSWNDSSNWIYTNRSRCPLIAKGRIYQIDHTQVQKGDIVYTYNDDESTHEKYTHVVIVAEAYNPSTRKCKVHGHTTNQLYQDKELTAGNCRCYRVSPIIKRESYEVRLALPENGNGASVYQ